MTQVSAARKAAVRVLGDVRRREGRARDIMRSSPQLAPLSDRDRALASRIVLGVVASRGLLDKTIDARCTRRSHLEPKVRDALRIATYELLFLATPDAVAVSQGVGLVRMVAPRAAGLANAVLRRVAELDVPVREDALNRVRAGGCELDDLVLTSGYPHWLICRIGEERGAEAARLTALSALEPAPVYVGTNEGLHGVQETERILVDAGLAPCKTDVEGAFLLRKPAALARLSLVESTDVVVADLSAQRIARSVVTGQAGTVLEIGQGRGTKTILMLGAARRNGDVIRVKGVESEAFKVRVTQERLERAGWAAYAQSYCLDARELASKDGTVQASGPFDAVFVDAPCSGTGTLRRHPEICWSLKAADVDALSNLQLQMFLAASGCVRKGGVLCYATCSLLEQENQRLVEQFLNSARGKEFMLVEEPFVSLPMPDGPDGHFCARMQRI